MKSTLVPGYREIFGNSPNEKYEEVIQLLPSDLIIRLCIIINGELNTPVDMGQTQKRLIEMVSYRFTGTQNELLNFGFERFRRKVGSQYKNFVFGRRYLLAMILKELNNFREVDTELDQSALQEYHFFKAYLLIVDEVNDHDNLLFNSVKLSKADPMSTYKLLWTPSINQFELSERTNVVYETFKLMSLLGYAAIKFRSHVKEYINKLAFSTIGQLLGSLNQVALATEKYYPKEVFKMLTYISPNEHVDLTHLHAQLISSLIGQKAEITILDIKKYPLYLYPSKGYMVVDSDLYKKKTYLGPFFELFYETGLNKAMLFNTYSSHISLEVLEKRCFCEVLKMLQNGDKGFLHFDDGSDTNPDGYYRDGCNLFLFEFKGYIFPHELSSEPDFAKIKSYIDSRFIKNERGKKKGVGQLKQQLENLASGDFHFDVGLKKIKQGRRLTVYPIICHTEFHFGLPGINKYLDDVFRQSIGENLSQEFDIQPITVVNLEVLFDFSMRVHHFKELKELIIRYHRILNDRTLKLKNGINQESFWRAHMSFDELYHSLFISEINKAKQRRLSFRTIIENMGISQQQLNEEL